MNLTLFLNIVDYFCHIYWDTQFFWVKKSIILSSQKQTSLIHLLFSLHTSWQVPVDLTMASFSQPSGLRNNGLFTNSRFSEMSWSLMWVWEPRSKEFEILPYQQWSEYSMDQDSFPSLYPHYFSLPVSKFTVSLKDSKLFNETLIAFSHLG